MTALALDDVRVTLTRGTRATLVDGVSLSVEPGEILGIVGETGAGKTMTVRAALGLLPAGVAAAGGLQVGGDRQIEASDAAAVRSLLGIETSAVFQNPVGMFDPVKRIGAQLTEGVVLRGVMDGDEASARADDLLSQMGFADPAAVQRRYPHQLSGGMAQRVATALGMMPRPRVLVLDEPTSALDANVRVEVLKLSRRLAQEEGTGVLMVSHDLGLVSHFCDRVAVMYAGRVVEQGPAADVVRAPTHPYTHALLRCSSGLGVAAREPLPIIEGAPPRPGAWPSGCVYEPRCPIATDLCVRERPRLAVARHASACHYTPDA